MVEDAAVTVGLILASTMVFGATSLGRAKAHELVREHSIDRELDDLNTIFAEELEAAIESEDAGRNSNELAGITDDWRAVTREVHGLGSDATDEAEDGPAGTDEAPRDATEGERIVFADEEEAVETIAEGIADVQGYTLSETGTLERELKQALSIAYRRAVDRFIDEIAGTALADAVVVEAQLTELDELRAIQEHLETLDKD